MSHVNDVDNIVEMFYEQITLSLEFFIAIHDYGFLPRKNLLK